MKKPLIVITGATSGIGKAIAVQFREKGYPLLLLGRNIDSLESLKADQVMIESVDVTDLDAFKQAVGVAEKKFGSVDAIVNCAGVMLLGDVATQEAKEWKSMLDVNVLGVLNGMQVVLPGMKSRKHGTIFNVSSIAGIKPFPNHAAYVGTKFAVHGMSDNVREEVAPYNVRVIIIAPGAVETPLLSHTTSQKIKDDYAAWKEDMGGVLSPEDIARTILFAYEQPQSVCLREIVISTTKQAA